MSGIIETMLLCLMEVISGDVFISLFFEKRGKRNFWKTVLFGLLLSCASTINAKVLRDFLILKLAVTVFIYTIFMLFRYRAKLAKMLLKATSRYPE